MAKKNPVYDIVESIINPEGSASTDSKIPNLMDIMTNKIGTPMMADIPQAKPQMPGTKDPTEMRNDYDQAMDLNVKSEPVNPELFKFQGRP